MILKTPPPILKTAYHSCYFLKQLWKFFFMSVFRSMSKRRECCYRCHPIERQTHLPYSLHLASCNIWPFPKVKLAMEGNISKKFWSWNSHDSATKKPQKSFSGTTSESWQEQWDKGVQSKGCILKKISGDVSFTVAIF